MLTMNDALKAPPGSVLPGSDCQNQIVGGVHWLRNSFEQKDMEQIKQFTCYLFGESELREDVRGHFGYAHRMEWLSGVSLNFDDPDMVKSVHRGCVTLDCPGKALDELSPRNLLLLLEFCQRSGGNCTRLDAFFDDFDKVIMPSDFGEIVRRRDFTGLKRWTRIESGKFDDLLHDEIAFGGRGRKGNGTYLRIYDKNLESDGDIDSVRYEVEFTRKKAAKAQKMLVQANRDNDVDGFACMCGRLVTGCIDFVHRTGEKHVSRLSRLDFWAELIARIGEGIRIRIARKIDSVTTKISWVENSVSTTLGFLRRVFVSDRVFDKWLKDVCRDGDARMKPALQRIADVNEFSIGYEDRRIVTDTGVPYNCRTPEFSL